MWDTVALVGVALLAVGALVALGMAVMRGELRVAKTENEILKSAKAQGIKAVEATGDVLKAIRERSAESAGPLDRADVRRLFGDRGAETGPPGGGAPGPRP